MVKRLRGLGLQLVSCLLVLIFVLSACADYTSPASSSSISSAYSSSSSVVGPGSNQGQPVVQIIKQNPAANPVALPANPTATTGAKTGANVTKTSQTTPVSVIDSETAVQGLDANPGFYEFPYADSKFYIHMPPAPKNGHSLQIILAIHGMGGNGVDFGQPLISYADQYGFVLVAPTMMYNPDYTDPGVVAANDEELLPELHSLVQALPGIIGFPVNQQVMLFGFSRGAQIVHRFALFYPEQIKGVALMSAGSYTLPYQDFKGSNDTSQTILRFPYGISDLAKFTGHNFDMQTFRKVPFWIGVGGADNATKDVPAAWNPYLGATRVERATRFYQALQKSGINATLNIFPGVGHAVCADMKKDGFAFFNSLPG
jgi:predicted esterase